MSPQLTIIDKVEQVVAWLIGTFGFGLLPLLFSFQIEVSNRVGAYVAAEGWIFSLILFATLIVDEGREYRNRAFFLPFALFSACMACIASFEYSLAISLRNPGWESAFVASAIIFALAVKLTQSWRFQERS